MTVSPQRLRRPSQPNRALSWLEKIENIRHQNKHLTADMKKTGNSIFAERYRVVEVADDRLLVRGILSGEVLTIINPEPEFPLSQADFPPGKLIALTDPSSVPLD
ncbi:MAG: hypothetical protein WBQ72_16340 [Terriglobales bacterium]